MKIKFGLRFKVSLLFLGLIVIVLVAVRIFLYRNHKNMIMEQKKNYAVSIARIVDGMMDTEKLSEYTRSGETDEEYEEMIEQMKKIQNSAELYYLYIVTIENEEDGIYFFDLKREGGKSVLNHSLGESVKLKKNYPGLSEVIASKSPSPVFDKTEDDAGQLDSVYVPMMNEDNEAVSFVGVDFDSWELAEDTRRYIDRMQIYLLGIMAACFIVLLLIVSIYVLRPIRRLEEQAQKISDGDYGTELPVRGHDEISKISMAFNRMSQSIAGSMERIQRLNAVYYRYVPAGILTLLGKDSIEEVDIGDGTSTMLTVFSFQMADFDRTIRKKTNREMIDAINQILQVCVPVVADQEGMVENFQNAGFTALYDNGCEAAVRSAVEMCQNINELVSRGKLGKNRAAIGISCGTVELGIVGEEERMAAITVSQYRDVACWLQSIAEMYQSHILITETAADRVPGFFERYHTRFLGFLYNTYTGHRDRIYDIYDGDAREELENKDDTKELFESGINLYCVGDFTRARQRFIAVLKRFRKDRAAKEYLYLCEQQMEAPAGTEPEIYFTRME